MRIGIDGYNLALARGTGIATYGLVLARTLQAQGHMIDGVFGIDAGDDPLMRETLFFERLAQDTRRAKTRLEVKRERSLVRAGALIPFAPRKAAVVPLTDRVEKAVFAQRLPTFDRLFTIPFLFEMAHRYFNRYRRLLTISIPLPPDVMHWTYPVPVRMVGARNIYTLHDLVPLKLPYTTLDGKQAYRSLIEACVGAADAIATVSEASARDIRKEFPIATDKIVNTYQASPMAMTADAASFAEDSGIVEGVFGLAPRSYFLFFGSIEPKKNLGRLLEAYLGLATTTPLVIVGAQSWQAEEELRLLSTLGEDESRRVIRLEYLPRPLLQRLVRCARAVMFPSLYEGFGLPILEAMQLGTPVLTSNTSSIPEIVGGAAILIDPYDPSSIAEGLRRLDENEPLRAELSAGGIEQAHNFSLDRYAERLDRLYARAAA